MFNQIWEIIKMNKLLIFAVAAVLSFVSVEGCASMPSTNDNSGISLINMTGEKGHEQYRTPICLADLITCVNPESSIQIPKNVVLANTDAPHRGGMLRLYYGPNHEKTFYVNYHTDSNTVTIAGQSPGLYCINPIGNRVVFSFNQHAPGLCSPN